MLFKRPRFLLIPVFVILCFCWAKSVHARPDLCIDDVDISGVTGDYQTLQVSGTVNVTVSNAGDQTAGGFSVLVFDDVNRSGVYDAGIDMIFGSGAAAPLDPAMQALVPVAVSGGVGFRDDLVFALADDGDQVVESDEGNNVSNSGDRCNFRPAVGSLDPVFDWRWTSSTTDPDSLNVMATPGVMDINGDRVPDVVFASTSSRGGGRVEIGILRALSGRDGSELWNVTDPALQVNTTSSVALGDIDLDGKPEIIACDTTGAALMAFEHDGTLKWRSAPLEAINWGAPAIADLDGDGTPEIIVGRQALDASGAVLWTGAGGRGGQGGGPLSLVSDIDLDGRPEVVAGNTVYDAAGGIKWQAPIPDGYPAVGNFDADNQAEVVVVASGAVYLLGHDGALHWGPSIIPGGGSGGSPIVADYDNDGAVEIGVAGATRYAVYETDGSLKWESPTQDASSNVTGSSAFDFDGNGSAEVVYRDELYLRIYNGSDGAVLFTVPMSSCTWHEYVLVADVDGDFGAEIVAVANDNCGLGVQRGVYVLGDSQKKWVKTRPVWNEHTYHITNVSDRGEIPAVEQINWLYPSSKPLNNFRQNLLTRLLPAQYQPDLTASLLQCAVEVGNPGLAARVGNGGAVAVPAGAPVSFYHGDPAGPGVLLGTSATTLPLAPGDYEDVFLARPTTTAFSDPLWAVADDAGGLTGSSDECNEGNNAHESFLPLVDAGADLTACRNADAVFTAAGTVPQGCPGGLRYEWRRGVVLVRTQSTDPVFRAPTTSLGSTVYTALARCADPPGCWAADDVRLTVEVCHTPVRFAWYQAEASGRGVVRISFATLEERDVIGFKVLRFRGDRDPGAAVTDRILPAHGTGVSYEVVDPTVPARACDVRYQVVEITGRGEGDRTPRFPVETHPSGRSVSRQR